MSLSNAPYDPQDPDEQPKSALINRKDAIRLLFGLGIVFLILIPLYNKMMDDRNKYVCRSHLGEIYKAMQIYASQNTDRLPPAFAIDPNTGGPIISTGDRYSTWVSVISNYINEPNAQFTCPSAHGSELVKNAGPNGATLESHYGLFGAMAAMAQDNVENKANTVLIAESSNLGSMDTFDPLIFGEGVSDGFLIGFDNSNFAQNESRAIYADSKFATRLAFRNSKDKKFDGTEPGRHGDKIHVVYVDGHIGSITSKSAHVQHMGDQTTGLWSVR